MNDCDWPNDWLQPVLSACFCSGHALAMCVQLLDAKLKHLHSSCSIHREIFKKMCSDMKNIHASFQCKTSEYGIIYEHLNSETDTSATHQC